MMGFRRFPGAKDCAWSIIDDVRPKGFEVDQQRPPASRPLLGPIWRVLLPDIVPRCPMGWLTKVPCPNDKVLGSLGICRKQLCPAVGAEMVDDRIA